jgi:hypothetical protein
VNDEEMSVEFKRFLVMGAGFGTVIGTLVLAGTTGLIDWLYAYHRIVVPMPTGAFVLGVLAGSGFGIAGWFLTHLRFTTSMLKGIVVSMVVAYGVLVATEYAENAPRGMGFFAYFDASTQLASMTTNDRFADRTATPKALGVNGYGYRFLELFGLTFGGMGALFIVPAVRHRLGLRDR